MSHAALILPAADPAQALIQRQLAILTRLAEIGMAVAEAAGRRAEALAGGEGSSADAPDPGLSFARAARAVRLTLALQARLAQDLAALGRAETLTRASEAARRRSRIHRRVDQALEAQCDHDDEIERQSSAVWERLTETEDEDLAAWPVDEVVARICRDLGLSPAGFVSAFAVTGGGDDGDGPPVPPPRPPVFGVPGPGVTDLRAPAGAPAPQASPAPHAAARPRAPPAPRVLALDGQALGAGGAGP